MDGVTDETQKKFPRPDYVPARTLKAPHAPLLCLKIQAFAETK